MVIYCLFIYMYIIILKIRQANATDHSSSTLHAVVSWSQTHPYYSTGRVWLTISQAFIQGLPEVGRQ